MSSRRDARLEEFERRKLAEKDAHSVVKRLLEVDVTKNVLLTSLKKITPQHYDDVIEERSLSDLCGYCLCRNEVKEMPKQQYRIAQNRVYDITERKKFCSNQCFGLSQKIREQISTVPLWLRNINETPDIEIPVSDIIGVEGEEVKLRHIVSEYDVEVPHSGIESPDAKACMKPTSEGSRKESKKAEKDLRTSFLRDNYQARCLKRTQAEDSAYTLCSEMFAVLKEWMTPSTREFLGFDVTQDKDQVLESSNKEVSQKQDLLEKQLNCLILGSEHQKSTASSPMPDYRSVEDDVQKFESKVLSFYGSPLQIKEKGIKDVEIENVQNNVTEPELPTVDSRNQMAIRQKIVMDKVKKILDNFPFSLPNVSQELRRLIQSFRFTSKNVMLSTDIWMPISLALLFLLGIRNQRLQEILNSRDRTHIIDILLKPYKIEAAYFQSTVSQIMQRAK